MKIRRILLISFLVLLSLVAISLTALSFFSSRSALQEEIGLSLSNDADMLMEEVDMLMFERLQNVHSWSHLDIIQEARIGDVDKRLSQFLADVEVGYKGMYRELYYVDSQQRVIAASSPELIDSYRATPTHWVKTDVPNGQVFIDDLNLSPPPYDMTDLVIRAPVLDRYSSDQIGQLYGLFDMRQIFRLLDRAGSSSSGERYVALLDAEGRTIAGSAGLRKPDFLLNTTFADWKPEKEQNLFIHSGDPLTTQQVLVGYAHSKGYMGYAKTNWSILILQSTDKAFLPIHSLWLIFSIVIIVTLLLAFLASHWISGRIAKPLLSLTEWVKQVRHFDKHTPPKVGGTDEVRELEDAFSEMLDDLEVSRNQVIQAAKLAVVGEMAAIMAHEVRTPLGILSTSAQMLQREPGLSPEGKEMTQFILDESARLRNLVTTMLECGRPREPQMLRHNLHDLIGHTIEMLSPQAHKKQIFIEQQLLAHNPFVVCDAELLTQVFLNLLINAIQIVPNDGKIRVRTSSNAQFVSTEIIDNGPGIAMEDFPHLFDPFFTKRAGGIGLGLTVTRQIVLAHHGKLAAIPSEWGGACFTLNLPINHE